MELKLEKKTYPVFKETTAIPGSMRHILQVGYTALYKEGPFGHILVQEKQIDIWKLYLYYVEVLYPFEFYISSPYGLCTVIWPMECNPVMRFNDSTDKMTLKNNNFVSVQLAPFPFKHYMEIKPPFYCSWQMSTHIRNTPLWKQQDKMEELINQYAPVVSLKAPENFIPRMPLA